MSAPAKESRGRRGASRIGTDKCVFLRDEESVSGGDISLPRLALGYMLSSSDCRNSKFQIQIKMIIV
jgi:hypothetical protein